jgi:hypothetical protein
MYKLNVLLMACLLVVSFNSCKKYLTLQPESAFEQAFVFSDVATATSAVLGVYGRLTGESAYGSRLSLVYPLDADDFLAFGNTSSGGGDNGSKAIARYNATPENSELTRPYNQLYSGIEAANICIRNIPAMTMYQEGTASEQAALRRLHGEALTLRAQFYFELIRNWGDVTVQWIPSTEVKDFFQGKTDRDTIYHRLLQDLLAAEDMVPWRNESGVAVDERITKGGVKAIRAKLALFCGGYSLRRASGKMERRTDYLDFYTICRDECRDIINSGKHALNPSFQAVFKDNIDAHRIEPNGELLFEVALAGGLNTTDGRLGNADGPNVGANTGGGGVRVVPLYYYAFDTFDTRLPVTIADYTINTSNNKIGQVLPGIASGKFRRDWISNPTVDLKSTASYFGVNWPVIRYSDVLLMFAETENELNNGPTAEAITAFEQVRKRAFRGNEASIGVTPTDYAGFFNAIVNERWFEFGGEGIRKYDLIRWNLLQQRILHTRTELTKMLNREAPYDTLPRYRYYKNFSTDIVWGNSMYKPEPATGISGYTRINWTAAMSALYITNVAELYQPDHGELLPLPQAATAANPNLKQDYGY